MLLGVIQLANAQVTEELFIRVLDLETKQPISFATVRFGDSQRGIVANEDGDFRLPLDFKQQNETIIISSIGFESLTIAIDTFNKGVVNTIYLRAKFEPLEAVIIAGKTNKSGGGSVQLSAEEIIKNAIGRIPTNYPYQPHSTIAYYRDYQIVNDNYYNLNEGILEDFDSGFNTNKYSFENNNTALYLHKLNTNFYQDTLLLKSVYGKSKSLAIDKSAKLGMRLQNELEILNIHNPIRNFKTNSFSFIYVFRKDFASNHYFKILSIKYIDNQPLYEIAIVTKDNINSRYVGSGKIFIAKSNYAIHKLEYGVYDKGKNATRGNPFGNTRSKITKNDKKTLFEVTIEYKAIGSKMYVNYMTFNNRFIINEPKPFKVEELSFSPKNQNFYLTFNESVDETSINRRSNFKLYYQGKKLIVKEIELVEKNEVRIEVLSWSAGKKKAIIEEVSPDDFSYKIKNIKDTFGREINKRILLTGYQFRELFTQEVFENKRPDNDLIFVNKSLPLSNATVNEANVNIDKYWVNSPLKQAKGRN
jgi:hypothetical protein